MGLRVLDDERPGFAQLAFTGSIEQPSISISVRSLRENSFLGPRGKWQKTPHYFSAERIESDGTTTLFRVGPEIVNHLLEHDTIEVGTADGTLHEQALWENAVPELPSQSSGYAIYSAPPAGASKPKPPAETQRQASPPPPTAPEPPQPVETPPAELPKAAPAVSPPPPPVQRPWWIFAAPVVVLAVAGAALAGFPKLRCTVFGISCPEAPKDYLGPALACASSKRADAPCDVEACFSDYFANTPADKVVVNVRTTIDEAKNACSKKQAEQTDRRKRAEEEAALQSAQQCAKTVAACAVRSCYASYLSIYEKTGALRSQAQADLARADKECPTQKPAAVPIPFDEWQAKPSGFYFWHIPFDPSAFDNEQPQLRSALLAARSAYREQNPQAILDALRGADASNPNVNLFKGFATLVLAYKSEDEDTRGLLQAEAIRDLNAAASRGNLKAAAILGNQLTMNMKNVPRDVSRARELAERAGRSSDGFAVRQLGIDMLSGAFGSADPTRAADLMWTAAELGDPPANVIVAAFFQNGTGVPVDMEKAEKYLRRAADLGLTSAQEVLGDWIIDRYAKEQISSPEEGVRYLDRAFNRGRSMHAVWRLAVLYDYTGRQAPWRDRNKALEYALKCAPYSFENCHFSLGVIYKNLNDLNRSWAYYTVARGLGSKTAVERLDTLEKSMTQREIESARTLADRIKNDLSRQPPQYVIQDVSAATQNTATNYADELTDWGVFAQTNLKYDVGTKTPISVPSARRITTLELQDLRSTALLIDVLDVQTGHSTIPGAIHMPGGGNYGSGRFDDQIQDKLFTSLSTLMRRNPDRPIVFFCASSQCWESYNATLRTMKMGFRNVMWYRGGLASWKAANLPLAPPSETYPIR